MSQLKDNAVVSVFGSREPQPGSALYESSKKLGHLLAKAGFVVATGGYEGTMAAISQGAAEAGGLTIGVTSAAVEASRDTSANRWIGQEIRFETLHDRLYHLVTENQAMVVLDGGIGTLSEFTLAWSLIQVGEIEERPLVIMGQLWKEILPLFMNSDYVPERSIQLVRIVDTPAEVVAVLKSYKTQSNREAE